MPRHTSISTACFSCQAPPNACPFSPEIMIPMEAADLALSGAFRMHGVDDKRRVVRLGVEPRWSVTFRTLKAESAE